eukprot:CCRYP_007408-RA/>CCRYP_007408-RA protein AED:0.36 eAED:0.34 QI:0/0/0/1/0/0/3/0/377
MLQFWENPGGIANIISLIELERDGWGEVTSPDGEVTSKFLIEKDGVCKGMSFINLANPNGHIVYNKDLTHDGMAMVETVRNKYVGFTREQVTCAAEARNAMTTMGRPTEDKYKEHVVSSGHIVKKLNLTLQDIAKAKALFSPDRGSLKGKAVRQRQSRVRPEYVSIPWALYERLRNVTIAADVMFVNGLPFFVTVSRGIKLVTAKFLPRTAAQLCSALKKVIYIYRRGGFTVCTTLMDMEFEPLVNMMDEVTINTTAAREHSNQGATTLCYVGSPLQGQSARSNSHPSVAVCGFWMNAMPSDSGVLDVYSSLEIVTGTKLDFKEHCCARFGAYVEASYDVNITNTLKERTHSCIALGPTGSVQGVREMFRSQHRARG